MIRERRRKKVHVNRKFLLSEFLLSGNYCINSLLCVSSYHIISACPLAIKKSKEKLYYPLYLVGYSTNDLEGTKLVCIGISSDIYLRCCHQAGGGTQHCI